MALSLKAELDTWTAALKGYDEQDFEKALDLFSCISSSSKILTNMGLIYATIGEHETAVEHFVAATNFDPYLAIAHFQCGVSNFLLQRYDYALINFEDAYLYLRGNEAINYDQLGLKFKLFSAEIMFNKGLAQLNLGYAEAGIADMQEASKLKVTDEHNVIDEAIRDRGDGYTVFSIPVGILYRPSETKIKNSKSKDYLGKAKLVAASDSNDAFTEFTGAVKLQQATEDTENKDKSNGSLLSRSVSVPAPRIDPISPLPTALERAKTAVSSGAGIRPDTAAILASRRAQSVSNPVGVPQVPFASNTALSRSNSSRLARSNAAGAALPPPRAKTPLSTGSAVAGIGVDGPRASGGTGAVGVALTALRSPRSLPRLREQAQQSAPQPLPQPVKLGQYVNAFPAVPEPVQGEGHLTQFYNTYMDVYSDDQAMRSAPRPPTLTPVYPQTQPLQPQPRALPQEQQQQITAWMQPPPSSARSSGHTSASSGISRAPSRAANANANTNTSVSMNRDMGMNANKEPVVGVPNLPKGSANNASVKTHRRKASRRPAARRTTMYDDEEGDDGFVTGEYEESEMANIRVKLHYQDDIRGMTIAPTTSYEAFVERVTAKFGTSLKGLGMKFADEDGAKISLRDESDFELAIETAREGAKGRSEGKIEVWCVNV